MAELDPSSEGTATAEVAAGEPLAAPEVAAEPVVEAPAAETAEAPAEEAPAEAATEESTEEAPAEEAVVEEPVVEAPVEEPTEDPDGEKSAEEAKAPKPVYEDFKMPEGIKASAEEITRYTDVLGEYNAPQELGQKLFDMHAESLKEAVTALQQQQVDVFERTRAEWRGEFEKQAGNRGDTILNDAKFAITDTIRDTAARKELWSVLGFTGAGDHPAVINALAKIGRRLRERAAPAPGLGVNPGKQGNKWDQRYGSRT